MQERFDTLASAGLVAFLPAVMAANADAKRATNGVLNLWAVAVNMRPQSDALRLLWQQPQRTAAVVEVVAAWVTVW